MKILFTADWHLSEDRDQKYRLDVFERLSSSRVDMWYVLGDIFDRKGNHPPSFVDDVLRLMGRVPVPVVIVSGNHDGLTPTESWCRLFGYLNNCTVVYGTPAVVKKGGFSVDCYPFGSVWDKPLSENGNLAVFHGMIRGCILDNGIIAPRGIAPQFFSGYHLAIGGDIHVPQMIGENIVYTGAPHHLHFGDSFDPQVLIFNTENGSIERLLLPTQHEKRIVRRKDYLSSLILPEGSFVRFRADRELPTEERALISQIVKERGWILESIQCEQKSHTGFGNCPDNPVFDNDPRAVLNNYCSQNNIHNETKKFMVDELDAELK